MSEIQIQTTGHLTADVDLRYTPSGDAVATFRVAVTPRKRQGDGWVDGETTFLPCEAWKDLGEHVAESLGRGAQVFLAGVLRTQRWTDREGQDRERLFVRVDEIGPSLRFATARPVKVDRIRGGLPSATPATPAAAPEGDPWATAQGAVASQLGGREVPPQDPPF